MVIMEIMEMLGKMDKVVKIMWEVLIIMHNLFLLAIHWNKYIPMGGFGQ